MSKKKQEIINFFQARPGESFYLRELGRRLSMDPGNLSRLLKDLVKQKQIIRKKKGNQTYFSLSDEYRRSAVPEEDVKKALKSLEPDLIKFCQNLIRIPSVCNEHPEEKIAKFIAAHARSLGLKAQLVAKDRYRPNVIIDTEPSKKDNFLFLGHMDTVGVGAIDSWRYYPFSAHKSGGRIYGRGAIDMKAGIACEIYLMKLIRDLGLELPFNIRTILVSNEEGGSTARPIFDIGMEYLIKEGLVEGKAAIYGYGGTYNVGIGHRGVLRVKISTFGEAAHTGSIKSQTQERGTNAVTAMSEMLLALEDLKLPQFKHPHFPKHKNLITPGTMIRHGETAITTIPDYCESVIEVRYLPRFPINKVYHQIKDICEKIAKKRGIKVQLEKFIEISAVCLSPEEEIIEALKSACQEVYNQPITMRGTGPANESFLLIKRGIPTVVFGPIGGRAHSDDEFVDIKSLTKTLEVYLNTLISFAPS
jgi:acetylornithine deacetylase/succinyl-diaminopimelate desuccinylase family protein